MQYLMFEHRKQETKFMFDHQIFNMNFYCSLYGLGCFIHCKIFFSNVEIQDIWKNEELFEDYH